MNTNTINDLARFNPPHALEGWAAGYRANGEDAKAAECEAALELQATWRAEPMRGMMLREAAARCSGPAERLEL